jgi:hypothetical protein
VLLTRREGEYDEWKMVRAINQKRFDAGNKGGLAARLGVMFDSYPAAPGLFDAPIAAGNIHACPVQMLWDDLTGIRTEALARLGVGV